MLNAAYLPSIIYGAWCIDALLGIMYQTSAHIHGPAGSSASAAVLNTLPIGEARQAGTSIVASCGLCVTMWR